MLVDKTTFHVTSRQWDNKVVKSETLTSDIMQLLITQGFAFMINFEYKVIDVYYSRKLDKEKNIIKMIKALAFENFGVTMP